MLTKTSEQPRPALVRPEEGPDRDDGVLRELAVRQLERVRKFKLDLAAFMLGTVVLGAIWTITEYQSAGGWPDRISDNGGDGSWNPWFFWVVLVWGFLVALDGLKTYFHRPTTEAEIEREVERLKARQ